MAVAAGLLLLVAAVVIAVGAWIAAPGRCDHATFTSNRFGYCLAAPTGWTGDRATVGQTPVDQLTLKEAPATVFIQAVDIAEDQDLSGFADYVRNLDQEAGYQLSGSSQREVDGVDAVQWDVTTVGSDSATDTTAQKIREVVFVKEGTAWRVQLGDTQSDFDAHLPDLDQMLDTWRFR